MIPTYFDRWPYVQCTLADAFDERKTRSLVESLERAGARIVSMTHDEIELDAPIEARDRVHTMMVAALGKIPQSEIDKLARGDKPLERLVRPVAGERCPRCHGGANDTKICGLCGALCPHCGTAVGPYWCPGCGAT